MDKKFRVEYWNKDGSAIQVGDDFAHSLMRPFETFDEAEAFTKQLPSTQAKSILKVLKDGSLISEPF